jgi:hypothetical protein
MKNIFLKNANKTIFITLILSLIIFLCSCNNRYSSNDPTNSFNTTTSTVATENTLTNVSDEILKKENKMIEAEKTMDDYIENGRVMIREFDFKGDKMEAYYAAMSIMSEWDKALGFGGYRADRGVPGIYPMFNSPEGYYFFKQMYLSLADDNKILEYNVFFVDNYNNINPERFIKFLKGIYGVEISSEELQSAVSECAEHLGTVTQGEPYEVCLYNDGGVSVDVVGMEDITGEKYIAINSKYIP